MDREVALPLKPNGDDAGGVDILGDRFLIEVTEGKGRGKVDQLRTLSLEAQRRGIPPGNVALYGPSVRHTIRINAETTGFRVFKNRSDLIAWINSI